MEIFYLLFKDSDISERQLCNSCSWDESLVAVSLRRVTGEVELQHRRVTGEVELQHRRVTGEVELLDRRVREVEFLDRRVREVEVQDAELQMLSNLGIKLSTEEGEITTQLHGH